MTRAAIVLLGLFALVPPATADQPSAAAPLDTELHDFEGVASLANALRKSDLEVTSDAVRLGLVVKGPTAPDQAQQPVLAEWKSRIDRFDVMAGLQADRTVVRDGPAKWVGGLGMALEHELGREAIELRTSLGQNDQWGVIGLEVGPRLERRLPGGMLFVIDGKAEARTLPAEPVFAGQSLPGQAGDAGLGLIGLTGRTGLIR